MSPQTVGRVFKSAALTESVKRKQRTEVLLKIGTETMGWHEKGYDVIKV